jgi:hypothetical protein
MSAAASSRACVLARQRVEQRLGRMTCALNAAGIPYTAVPTRTTRGVDLRENRRDAERVAQVMESLGFRRADARGLLVFIDPEESDPRAGVRVVRAGEKVRPSCPHAAPTLDEGVPDPQGWTVRSLPALVRMKRTPNRDIDRVPNADLPGAGLIDAGVRGALAADLPERVLEIERESRRESATNRSGKANDAGDALPSTMRSPRIRGMTAPPSRARHGQVVPGRVVLLFLHRSFAGHD